MRAAQYQRAKLQHKEAMGNRRCMKQVIMSGAAAGLLGAGLTAAVFLLPKVLQKRKKTSSNKKALATEENAAGSRNSQAATQQTTVNTSCELRPFGSPVSDQAHAMSSQQTPTSCPGTPTAFSKAQVEDGDVGRSKDQAPPALTSASQLPTEPPSLKQQQQLQKALDEVRKLEEENAKLKTFMTTHLQASEKVVVLEEENKKLSAVMTRLEGELQEVRTRPWGPASGAELERFKGMLASKIPLEARSVCSDADAFFKDTGSVDGAATVAGFVAGPRRAPGWWGELANMLMMTPSAPVTMPRSGAVTPTAGSTAGSVKGAPPAAAARPITNAAGNSLTAQPTAQQLDVGHLLDGWGARIY